MLLCADPSRTTYSINFTLVSASKLFGPGPGRPCTAGVSTSSSPTMISVGVSMRASGR